MANTFLGVSIKFGTSDSTAIPGFAAGTFVLQDEDHDKDAKVEDVDDADGITVQRTIYNPSEKAKFHFVYKGASASAVATALGSATWFPAIGAIGTVTNAVDAAIAGTNWIIEKVAKKRSNTKAMLVTLDLVRFTGTNAISAVST
jgi:hypothetical protein